MLSKPPGPFWCISVNPAIDKRARVATLLPGRINRVTEMRAEPGGKAAHVAMVLRTLGADPLWLGFAGGPSGEQLVDGLEETGIRTRAIPIAGSTRVNLEIIDAAGTVTEVLEPGAPVNVAELQAFWDACEQLLSAKATPGIVVASGSLPPGVDSDFYAKLTKLVHRLGHRIFVDTSGEAMRLAIAAGPDFVKPNREESEALLGKEINDRGSQAAAVEDLLQRGALGAAVSLGRNGLVWRSAEEPRSYYAAAPVVDAKSSVGCGDSTLAAFAYAAAAGFDLEKTLRLAVACGSANCLAEAPGRLRESDVRSLEPQVHVEKLD